MENTEYVFINKPFIFSVTLPEPNGKAYIIKNIGESPVIVYDRGETQLDFGEIYISEGK